MGEILKSHPKGIQDIEMFANIVIMMTGVDNVRFVGYDVPVTNPILGSFRRFNHIPGAYLPDESNVEVRYALHLDDAAKCLVVVKELCHSLEAPDGAHAVSEEGLDDLVTAFSLFSGDEEPDYELHAFGVEMLALLTAIEVMCPLPRRRYLSNKYGANLDYDLICANYGLSSLWVQACFKPRYMQRMEKVYIQYGLKHD
ncbi:hypothetical protein [Tardiphaga sp.]|uniref:hypothetical protein n=1 Tax=Tardiphaga sp. TaxID=1926292 RepID=UPI00352AE2B2